MSDADDRRREHATWPGRVIRGGFGEPPRLDDPMDRLRAAFELGGWFDPTVPPLVRGPSMPGRVIRPGDR